MIRFVRIEHEDECQDDTWFSFYCTVMDDFVRFNNIQIFNSKEEFIENYMDRKQIDENRPIERFLSLIPNDLNIVQQRKHEICPDCGCVAINIGNNNFFCDCLPQW